MSKSTLTDSKTKLDIVYMTGETWVSARPEETVHPGRDAACGGTPWLEPGATTPTTSRRFNRPPVGVGPAESVEPVDALPASKGGRLLRASAVPTTDEVFLASGGPSLSRPRHSGQESGLDP